jgi:hypothetical protein
MRADRSTVVKNLPKKGFRKEKSGHHIYFYHEYKGRETGVYTYTSHSAKLKDISGDLLTSMRKQLRLETNKEAIDLFKCPMDGNAFKQVMINKNIIPPKPSSNKEEK